MASGSIVMEIEGRTIVPAYGRLTLSVGNNPTDFPIGSLGEFYLQNVEPGRHIAVVSYGTASCEITIDVPAKEPASIPLGTLRCLPGAP